MTNWKDKILATLDKLDEQGCKIEQIEIHHKCTIPEVGDLIGITILGDVGIGENVNRFLVHKKTK